MPWQIERGNKPEGEMDELKGGTEGGKERQRTKKNRVRGRKGRLTQFKRGSISLGQSGCTAVDIEVVQP